MEKPITLQWNIGSLPSRKVLLNITNEYGMKKKCFRYLANRNPKFLTKGFQYNFERTTRATPSGQNVSPVDFTILWHV